MKNCIRKERKPYIREKLKGKKKRNKETVKKYRSYRENTVEGIIRKWSVMQGKKDHVEQVLSTVSIDYSSQEIQEIREAVVELLTRYKDKINDRKHYKIRRIESCGSMREHTGVWKYGGFLFDTKLGFSVPYTEFDYLAVLEKPCCYDINIQPRKCCATVKKSDIDKPCSCEVPNCSTVIEPDHCSTFDKVFLKELCESVASLCDCYSMYSDAYCNYFRQNPREQQQQQRECHECTVYKPTGQLHIATKIASVSLYSLMLLWRSNAMTLVAPKGDITDEIKTTPIKSLPILIDFLPALEVVKTQKNEGELEHVPKRPRLEVVNTQKNEGELEHECFLVPKRCRLHFREYTWRLSGCVREIDHIVNKMSEKHRECYEILKYMCDRQPPFEEISDYDVKTSVLNHSVKCRDSSKDYRNCVTAVLKKLKIAYERDVLESFCFGTNLLEREKKQPRNDVD